MLYYVVTPIFVPLSGSPIIVHRGENYTRSYSRAALTKALSLAVARDRGINKFILLVKQARRAVCVDTWLCETAAHSWAADLQRMTKFIKMNYDMNFDEFTFIWCPIIKLWKLVFSISWILL